MTNKMKRTIKIIDENEVEQTFYVNKKLFEEIYNRLFSED